jgi:hypothetical protein
MSEIRKAVQSMAGGAFMPLIQCTVDSVNTDNDSIDCTPTADGEAELLDVSLRANIDETHTGFIIYPKVGSIVMVGLIEQTASSAVVLMCSEVEKILISIGGTKILIKAGKIYLNADADTGQHGVLGDTLKSDLAAMNDRIDKLFTFLQDPTFILKIVAAVADGGTSYNAFAQAFLPTAPPRPTLNILSDVIQLK